MCGEGLAATDGEDYQRSDCEADRQSVEGGGAHLTATDPSHMLRSGEAALISLSGQPSFPVPACFSTLAAIGLV